MEILTGFLIIFALLIGVPAGFGIVLVTWLAMISLFEWVLDRLGL